MTAHIKYKGEKLYNNPIREFWYWYCEGKRRFFPTLAEIKRDIDYKNKP